MMETALNKAEINCLERVFSVCVGCEETAESVVPDILPDICKIADADGLVLLRSKVAEQGRVSVNGTINATVLYLPEDGSGVCRLSIDVPYSISYECVDVSEASHPETSVRLRSIDARMLNPRKVLIRADVEAEIRVYNKSAYSVSNGIDAEEETSIQVLSNSFAFMPVISAKEKTFVMTDEYQIPANMPALDVLLRERLELFVDDIKSVGNKIIFKGIAKFDLMYASAQGDVLSTTWSSSFSQILEMNEIDENPEVKVTLMLTGAYFEPMDTANDGRVITAELHVVAQATCIEQREYSYISDAYSNKFLLDIQRETVSLRSAERASTQRETIHDFLETSTPVGELVSVYTRPGIISVNEGDVKCAISVHAIYKDPGGELISMSKKINADFYFEIDEGTALESLAVRSIEEYATPSAGGLEIRIPVEITAEIYKNIIVETVSGIVEDRGSPIDLSDSPSIIVLQNSSDDLWKLAKKYHSTQTLIKEANKISCIEEAEDILLVPVHR